MSKYLSIIIPRYKETERDIFPLLTSINNQVGLDWRDIEILICSDGGGPGALDTDFLGLFPRLDIRQVSLEENKGPGMARQAGIDSANGQYLMFCDADDMLYSVGVVGAMIQEAQRSAPDILSTNWLEEIYSPEAGFNYVTHSHEMTWMHGKLLRRHYLLENDIRHHPGLRVHEDSYILGIASSLTDRLSYLDIVSYVWTYRKDSITRRDDSAYTYESMPTFIHACCEADKVIEERNARVMPYRIVQLALYIYFCTHLPGWIERAGYRKAAEDALVKEISPLWHYHEGAPAELVARVYNEERAKNFAGCIEEETVTDWLKRLGL